MSGSRTPRILLLLSAAAGTAHALSVQGGLRPGIWPFSLPSADKPKKMSAASLSEMTVVSTAAGQRIAAHIKSLKKNMSAAVPAVERCVRKMTENSDCPVADCATKNTAAATKTCWRHFESCNKKIPSLQAEYQLIEDQMANTKNNLPGELEAIKGADMGNFTHSLLWKAKMIFNCRQVYPCQGWNWNLKDSRTRCYGVDGADI
mmetsp:Transcript_111937/g.316946  ORF Transcript_111937/g.316946 Transcript_111937/m.316946 type:complete len:204 (+) Transcript_111937:87-698(+)